MRYALSLFFQKIGWHNAHNFLKLYQLFKKESPDILYINNGGYPGAQSCRIATLSAKKAGIEKVILNINNLAFPQKGILDKWLDKKVDSAVEIFITASKAAQKQLLEQRKFNYSKCIDIPNTVLKEKEIYAHSIQDCLRREFKINENEIVLGAAGLLTSRKGFDILVDAVHLLNKSEHGVSFKFFIFGEGEQRKYLENKIKEYGLINRFFLPGFKNDVLPYMKGFDVFICPSVANEDFPYVILEAMLLRKPVIGTNIAGIPEQVLDQYNGFIVAPGDTEMLSKAILQIVSDKKLMHTMGENSYKRYNENFNNTHIMQRYQQLFDSLVN